MFGRSKRIKDLEEEITGLKSLCAQLTSNSLQLTKEYSLLVGAVKSLLQHQKIIDRIIEPTIRGLKEIGVNYKGFLYVGLMIVKGDPFLIEYNVRMGDPECQTILPKLNSNLLEIFLACCEGDLDKCNITWHDKKSLCIVLCAKGYPDTFKKKLLIKNIEKIKLSADEYLYHAGTTRIKDEVFSNGGRVLNFVCLSKDFLEARKKIFNLIKQLSWNHGFYRKDIGYKVID